MGAKCYVCSCEELKEQTENITIKNFSKKYAIGKGGYGKVWKVQSKYNHKFYAMKEISKVKAYVKKSLSCIISEQHILSKLHHPFLANLNFSFQDKEYLYLVLDYLPGGDLRFHINKGKIFSNIQIKFIISNLILALNYIHTNNIIHRDIKPENLVFDARGYLHITDFGIARKFRKDKLITDKSGTPGYFPPEILLQKPQNFTSDFFSMGVLCYELIFGKKPFRGRNHREIGEKVLYKNIIINKNNLPEEYPPHVGDFITRLLKRNQKERLGFNGIDEIKNHQWLHGVDWDNMENKLIDRESLPFQPMIGDNFDYDFVNKIDRMNTTHYEEYLKKINSTEIFKKFYFNYYSTSFVSKAKSNSLHVKTNISNKITAISDENNNEKIKNSKTFDNIDDGDKNTFYDDKNISVFDV